MQPFIAPKFNLPLVWTADLLFPFLLKAVQNIEDVIVRPEDLEMLRSLRKERMLFFTNHPTTAEPPIVFHLGSRMGARFRYMASRQVFDWGFGLVGQVISNIGAFSVIAGIADRDSLKTARSTLAEPSGKLVIFPEGEPTSGENDSLMPFQPGAAQLSFWAYEDAKKADPNADIYIVPGFIKYVMKGTPGEQHLFLEGAIGELEKKLGVNPGKRNLLRRFLHFGRCLLNQAEAEYKIPRAAEMDFDYRIGRLRHTILDRIAERLGVENYDKGSDAIMKLRKFFALLEMLQIEYPDPTLPKVSAEDIEWAHKECVKAFDFIVIKKEYLLSNPTPERFFEWLARFESYVYGKTPRALGGEPSPWPREAHVSIATPFRLSEIYPKEKKDKKAALNTLLERLRKNMQAQLDLSMNLTSPLVAPFDIGDDADI